jgi:hypothetical protein
MPGLNGNVKILGWFTGGDGSGGSGTTNTTQTDPSVTGTAFVLANTPAFIYGVYVNGVFYTQGVDYTLAAATITFLVALAADQVTVVYRY